MKSRLNRPIIIHKLKQDQLIKINNWREKCTAHNCDYLMILSEAGLMKMMQWMYLEKVSDVSDIRKDVSDIKANLISIKTELLYIRLIGLVIMVLLIKIVFFNS